MKPTQCTPTHHRELSNNTQRVQQKNKHNDLVGDLNWDKQTKQTTYIPFVDRVGECCMMQQILTLYDGL